MQHEKVPWRVTRLARGCYLKRWRAILFGVGLLVVLVTFFFFCGDTKVYAPFRVAGLKRQISTQNVLGN